MKLWLYLPLAPGCIPISKGSAFGGWCLKSSFPGSQQPCGFSTVGCYTYCWGTWLWCSAWAGLRFSSRKSASSSPSLPTGLPTSLDLFLPFLLVSRCFLSFLAISCLLSWASFVNSGWMFSNLVVFLVWPWNEVPDRFAYSAAILSSRLEDLL